MDKKYELIYKGKTYETISEAARDIDLSMHKTLHRNWLKQRDEKSFEEIVEDTQASRKKYHAQGKGKASCFDHLGNPYVSKNERAKAYGKKPPLVRRRLLENWVLENALLAPDDMEEGEYVLTYFYCISEAVKLEMRLTNFVFPRYHNLETALQAIQDVKNSEIAESVKTAFIERVKAEMRTMSTDHAGKIHDSNEAMRMAWSGVSETMFFKRLFTENYTVKEALIIPPYCSKERFYRESKAIEAAGYGSDKTFYSFANERGLSKDVIQSRIERYEERYGKDTRYTINAINNIFMRDVIHHREALDPVDHLGKRFDSLDQMCEAWGIERSLFNNRIRMGWSIEKALTTPKLQWVTGINSEIEKKLEDANIDYVCKKTIKDTYMLLGLEYVYEEIVSRYTEIMQEFQETQFNRYVIDNMKFNFILLKDGEIVGMIDKLRKCPAYTKPFVKLLQRLYSGQDRIDHKKILSEVAELPYLIIREDQFGCVDLVLDEFISNPEQFKTNHTVAIAEPDLFEHENKFIEEILSKMALA